MTSDLDPARLSAHRLANRVHGALLLGAILGLAALLGFLITGSAGLTWGVILIAVMLAVGQASPRLVLGLYGARPIAPGSLGPVHGLVAELARRAGLPRPPVLYHVPSQVLNAFAVGSREDSAVAVTDGMLRRLNLREITGVLAHEIAHVRHGDLAVMMLADVVSRVTGTFATVGQLLLIFNLPLLVMGRATVSWLVILVLMGAPTLTALLQLALSRSREFDADLEAASLTGDPEGLALALAKMERHERTLLGQILRPGHRVPDPSLFRTHPATEERIRRLLDLEAPAAPRLVGHPSHVIRVPPWAAPHPGSPRWRIGGVWY